MKISKNKGIASSLMLVSMMMLFSLQLTSNELDGTSCAITSDFYRIPYQLGSWNVGLEMIQMPRSVTGEELLHLPMVNAEYRVEFSEEVNVKLLFNSCYLINLGGVNINYGSRINQFKFEAGLTGKFWFGKANLDLVKAMGNGTFLSLSASGTYYMRHFALLAKVETDFFVNSNYNLEGGNFKNNEVRYSGTSLSLTYQQPLVGNVKLNLNAKVNLTELNYQQWIIYSSSNKKYFVPSFGVGVSF